MEPPGYTPDTDSGGMYHDDQSEDADATRGRSLLAARHVVDAFDASSLWKEGFSGKGVKAGEFIFFASVRAICMTSCFGNRYFRHWSQGGPPAFPQD